MKNIKRMISLLLLAMFLFSLAACSIERVESDGPKEPETPSSGVTGGDGNSGEDPEDTVLDMTVTEDVRDSAKALVQGKLDELYQGRFDPEYLSLTGLSEEEARENFQTGLSEQAGYFARYFDVEYLTDELNKELSDFWTEVYAQTHYTVGEVEAIGDGNTFAVSVQVEPMDLIQRMTENQEAAMAPYHAKYGNADMDSLSEEKRQEADALWAQCVMDLAREQLGKVGYEQAQTVDVLVTKGEDGVWTVAMADLYTVDDRIILFPDII